MRPPDGITNEPHWIRMCCRIRARAEDIVAGRVDILTAAGLLSNLATWTRLKSDPDVALFQRIWGDSGSIPHPLNRELWSPRALAKIEAAIRAFESKWGAIAIEGAQHLVANIAWTLEARRSLRKKDAHKSSKYRLERP